MEEVKEITYLGYKFKRNEADMKNREKKIWRETEAGESRCSSD